MKTEATITLTADQVREPLQEFLNTQVFKSPQMITKIELDAAKRIIVTFIECPNESSIKRAINLE